MFLKLPRFPAFLILLVAFVSSAHAARYRYDQDLSQVRFTLKHLGIVSVSGNFETFSGTFRFDPSRIEDSRVELTIQTASVASDNATRDGHLKSENFFWSEKFPEIRFVSREFKDIREDGFNIYGDLTIRDKTNPVVFETQLLTGRDAVSGDRPTRFRTQTFIHRKDFNLGTGNWMDPIMFITGETLRISLEVTGIPADSATG